MKCKLPAIPGNNNINGVVLASGNDEKTLNYSHDPGKELNKPAIYKVHQFNYDSGMAYPPRDFPDGDSSISSQAWVRQ